MDQVLEQLFLGNEDAATDRGLLKTHKITHVLRAGYELESPFEDELAYLKLDINDALAQPIKEHFPAACKFIEQAIKDQGRVLVHCAAGVSRSSTLTLAYLMQCKQMPLD
jgi:protein-tyrosine phosphatase